MVYITDVNEGCLITLLFLAKCILTRDKKKKKLNMYACDSHVSSGNAAPSNYSSIVDPHSPQGNGSPQSQPSVSTNRSISDVDSAGKLLLRWIFACPIYEECRVSPIKIDLDNYN